MRRSTWAVGKRFRGWIARAQNGICVGCGEEFDPFAARNPLDWEAVTLDHVYPKSKGGRSHLGNFLAMHRRCNFKKDNRPPTGCELIWLDVVNTKIVAAFPWAKDRF